MVINVKCINFVRMFNSSGVIEKLFTTIIGGYTTKCMYFIYTTIVVIIDFVCNYMCFKFHGCNIRTKVQNYNYILLNSKIGRVLNVYISPHNRNYFNPFVPTPSPKNHFLSCLQTLEFSNGLRVLIFVDWCKAINH